MIKGSVAASPWQPQFGILPLPANLQGGTIYGIDSREFANQLFSKDAETRMSSLENLTTHSHALALALHAWAFPQPGVYMGSSPESLPQKEIRLSAES